MKFGIILNKRFFGGDRTAFKPKVKSQGFVTKINKQPKDLSGIDMKVRYDPEIDAIYFDLSETKSFDSDEIKEGIIYDYDQNNNIVGIEILDFTWQKKNGLKIDDLPFNSEDKKIASQYFLIPTTV